MYIYIYIYYNILIYRHVCMGCLGFGVLTPPALPISGAWHGWAAARWRQPSGRLARQPPEADGDGKFRFSIFLGAGSGKFRA